MEGNEIREISRAKICWPLYVDVYGTLVCMGQVQIFWAPTTMVILSPAEIQMVSDLGWLNLQLFDFMMVRK